MFDLPANTPRERRHLRTQQAILDAARRIVADEGADALSMRAIAERIDYSAAGLYEYFDSKEAIVQAVCWDGHRRLKAALVAAREETAPPNEQLLAIGLAYIDFALWHPEHYRLMFTKEITASNEDDMQDSDDSAFTVLVAVIQHGIDLGLFHVRPGFGLQEMAYAAWTQVHGIAMLRLIHLVDFPVDFAAADRQTLLSLIRGLRAS